MRVWIINHYAIPPSMGGLVRHYYFSKFLRERGHQVHIFTASEIHNTDINMIRDGALYREETMDGVPYTFLKTRDYSGNGLSRIINMLEFPLRIQQSVNRFAKAGERPDVIYTSAPTIFAAASAVIAAKRLKVPCVVEVRDIWPESIVEYKGMSRKNPVILALYALEKWLYKNADRLIFTMEGGPDYIKEKHWENKIPLAKIDNLNNGVDLAEFDENCQKYTLDDPDLLDESTFNVVYTGSIRLVNNLEKIVEVAERMQQRGEEKIRFLLYGDGTEREHINHVKQTGIMRFGCSLNKQFDYFASGKPVLSDLTVNYDLIQRYGAGVTLPDQDTESLCREILRFAHMPKDEYQSICRNARRAAEDYDYRTLTGKLEDILQTAVFDYRGR